jgi:hypothetical protein
LAGRNILAFNVRAQSAGVIAEGERWNAIHYRIALSNPNCTTVTPAVIIGQTGRNETPIGSLGWRFCGTVRRATALEQCLK